MKKLMYLSIAALISVSCMSNDKGGKEMSDSGGANKARMQDFYDQVMNAHNPAAADSFCSNDFVDHMAMPNTPAGIEGIKGEFKEFFAAFPDLHFKTNFMKSFGDTIISHYTLTATNSGSFMGMPASNKQFSSDGIDIVIIKNGKATEHWGYDDGKMMMALGMGGPPPPPAMDGKK